MPDDAIRNALSASKTEQLPTAVYVQGVPIMGIVARVDDATVELRAIKGRTRSVIRIDRIDAVVLE